MKLLDVAPSFAKKPPSLEKNPMLARAPLFTSDALIFILIFFPFDHGKGSP